MRAEAMPQIGDKMPDGTVYAGLSPDTNKPMYTTPADVVHAISPEVKKFYLALGFDPSPREPMMLMVTLPDVRAALL